MLARVGTCLLAVLLVGGGLTSCSGDDSGDDIPTGGGSSSATATASTPAASESDSALPVPAGVELSPEGSQLQVGETATVAYEPAQGQVGVLGITVTRLEKTSIGKSFVGWDLDQGQKNANPYFVRATVINRGETDLGGRRVPLYIVDGDNTLIESTSFASAFTPCEPGSFPKKFLPGEQAEVCLVYLAPKNGDLTAVSFRPTQAFDPITWTGELKKPKKPKPPKGKGKGAQPSASATP